MRGFTVIELLVVIAIVAGLASMAFLGFRRALANARISATQTVVTAVATAIAKHPTRNLAIPTNAGTVANPVWSSELLPAWDANGDGWLDGDPTKQPPGIDGTGSEFDATLSAKLASVNYRGLAAVSGDLALPARNLDRWNRILDSWGHRLRIAPAGTRSYGGAWFGVWSIGPDSQDALGDGDDITSWSSKER